MENIMETPVNGLAEDRNVPMETESYDDDPLYRPSTSGCSNPRKRSFREIQSSESDGNDGVAAAAAADERGAAERRMRMKSYRMYEIICGDRKIVLASSQLNFEEKIMLDHVRQLYKQVSVKEKWDETVTHFIVHTGPDNKCKERSAVYMNALLSHCYIVSTNWLKECLTSGYLVPEYDYIVTNKFGVPSALNSWRFGRGITESPMQWAANCVLYFFGFNKTEEKYSNIIKWSKKVGFVMVESIEEFKNHESRLKIVITNQIAKYYLLPTEINMMDWLCEYKAISVHLDWLLKCLYEYRLHPIEKAYQVMELDKTMVAYTDLFGYVTCLF